MSAVTGSQVEHVDLDDDDDDDDRSWYRSPSVLIPIASGVAFAAGLVCEWTGAETAGLVLFWIGLLLGAYTFVPGALRKLFTKGKLGIGLLMTISATGAVILGYVEEAAALAFLYSIAEALEDKAMDRARAGLRALLKLVPDTALVKRGDATAEVEAKELRVGDVLVVRPGERIATDANAGASVALADVKLDSASALAATLPGPGVHSAHGLDVADASRLDRFAAALAQQYGRVDFVIPAAGIYPTKPLIEMTGDDWRRVMSINLDGVFFLLRRLVPLIRDGGAIVNFASVAGHRGSHSHGHYAAAKAGVISLTRTFALELKDRVRVNAVSPGTIVTGMTNDLIMARGDALLVSTPMGRHGEPSEVASVVAFLTSDGASFVHGEVVHVNGGLFMAG